MSKEEGKQVFQTELVKLEAIAGLRQALDSHYRRMCEAARSDWERLFGGKDPADSCVSVRVANEPIAIQAPATRGSGFLKSRRSSGPKPASKGLPGFAH
jgi:hypothetical protein